jgi:tripartite-type tricarboxylate transporter receptor subunit TctC
VVGASAAASNNSAMPNLLNSLLHTRFKVVNGYQGSGGIALALERGEVQAMVGDGFDFLKATKGQWLRDQKIRILMQATVKRHEDLPDAPTALELVAPENREVLALLLARQTYAGLLLAPPEVAAPMVARLREGFGKMVDDADFRRDAQESNLTLHPASAAEVASTLGRLMASPRPVIERASAELRIIPN